MGTVKAFCHPPKVGHWSRVKMDSGEPCWISISQQGVLIKKSRIGLFGKKIIELKPIDEVYAGLSKLEKMFPNKLTPEDMSSFILQYFTNAALNCKNLEELKIALEKVFKEIC